MNFSKALSNGSALFEKMFPSNAFSCWQYSARTRSRISEIQLNIFLLPLEMHGNFPPAIMTIKSCSHVTKFVRYLSPKFPPNFLGHRIVFQAKFRPKWVTDSFALKFYYLKQNDFSGSFG